jgi:hydroxymethylbilane synthase
VKRSVSKSERALRIGTRGSDLARWQAARVRELLAARNVAAELVIIRTSGDEGSHARPAPGTTGKRLFTKEIEDALLAGRIDLAVHSLKDLSAELPRGLTIAAYPEREDIRDAMVGARGLKGLPHGATVGTSSLRRRAALLAARGDLNVVPLRGNVPTRVAKVGRNGLTAAVLAMAGLKRLQLAADSVPLDPMAFPPAPGQGALALEVRDDDREVCDLVRALDDASIRCAVEAERAALAELQGGCQAAIGAYCAALGERLTLHVTVFAPDGSRVLRAEGPLDRAAPAAGAKVVAGELAAAGAGELIRAGEAFVARLIRERMEA